MSRIAHLLLLFGLAGASLWAIGGASTIPAHLEILSAGVAEILPIETEFPAARRARIDLELRGAPTCNAGTGQLAYGLFIDADRNPDTGLQHPATDIGIDARSHAVCDPQLGRFTSPLGEVSVSVDPQSGTATLSIDTRLVELPSPSFDWVAFVLEDGDLYTLPERVERRSFRAVLGHGTFSTLEISTN